MRENGEREGGMWERDCADAKGTLREERLEEDVKEGHFLKMAMMLLISCPFGCKRIVLRDKNWYLKKGHKEEMITPF